MAFKLSLAEAKLKALNQKQACAPLGDDQDEALEIGALMGQLSDLGANLPEVVNQIQEAPQVGEGGINNEPAAKESD